MISTPRPATGPARPSPQLLGRSLVMVALREQLDRIARSSATVLVTGETGTGKDMVARYLHAKSPRRDQPFVALNCAALPEALIESELFGHARGAFTGAHAAYPGKIRLAAGGTLVLDEIGDMATQAQARLLRFLETGEVFSVGGLRTDVVDVRVVAATHQDLAARVQAGLFRKDVYYRLNIARVELLPLCARRGDLDELIGHFLAEVTQRHALHVQGISEPAHRALLRYAWPGNIRELKNVLESAALQADGGALHARHLPTYVTAHTAPPQPVDERALLLAALHQTKWNKSAAAAQLHWSRMTLYRKLSKYALHEPPGAN
ncbi:MAG: sigma-54 dependent transcriptional regulator [Rubrivivax sp.]|nr:sigma-54 dependent transcriptional regulator [Rubrivivax sp.]